MPGVEFDILRKSKSSARPQGGLEVENDSLEIDYLGYWMLSYFSTYNFNAKFGLEAQQ